MADITEFGTIADGDALKAAYFNDWIIHREKFTGATVRTIESTSWTDSGTAFTFTAPVSSMIMGLRFKFTMNNGDAAETTYVGLKINGTNLGSLYLRSMNWYINLDDWKHLELNSSENAITSLTGTSQTAIEFRFPAMLEILDTSTTFTVRLKSSSAVGGKGAIVRDVELDVIYAKGFVEE